MLQLKNNCAFKPGITLFPDEHGVDTLYVAVRGTFTIGPGVSIADEQIPPNQADLYWGDPALSSLKYASEVLPPKPTTDVALIGDACAPGDGAVDQLVVRLAIAEREKTLRVFGDRRWKNGRITSPAPFKRMPVVYERAFGGTHETGVERSGFLAEERNPIGRGFRGKRTDKALEDMPLPNIEDPRCLVGDVGDKAIPAGFGFVAPAWMPRRQFAGTYDEAWQTDHAPYLPGDFDRRFLNAAHPDLIFDRYLRGGEPVEVDNLSNRGRLRFTLPKCELKVDVRIAGQTEVPTVTLDTVLIEPEFDRFSMTWRCCVPCDKRALRIETVSVNLQKLELGGGTG